MPAAPADTGIAESVVDGMGTMTKAHQSSIKGVLQGQGNSQGISKGSTAGQGTVDGSAVGSGKLSGPAQGQGSSKALGLPVAAPGKTLKPTRCHKCHTCRHKQLKKQCLRNKVSSLSGFLHAHDPV